MTAAPEGVAHVAQETDRTAETDWRSKAAISIEEAAKLLGLGRNSAYDAAKRGEIPSVRVGARILVPVAKLRAFLGEEVGS